MSRVLLTTGLILPIFLTARPTFGSGSACEKVFTTGAPSPRASLALSWNEAVYGFKPGLLSARLIHGFDDGMTIITPTPSFHADANGKAWGGELVRQVLSFRYSDSNVEIEKAMFRPNSERVSGEPSREYSRLVARFRGNVARIQRQRNLNERGRKRSWSEETVRIVKSETLEYADQTQWITVRVKDKGSAVPGPSHRVDGALKLVLAGNHGSLSRLPLERDFGIELAANGGRKIELGNYAVDPGLNAPVTLELFIQLAIDAQQRMRDPGHRPGQDLYYMAADPVTSRIYRAAGLRALQSTKDRDGSEWNVLGASAEDLFASVSRLLADHHRAQLEHSLDRSHFLEALGQLEPLQSPIEIWPLWLSPDSIVPKTQQAKREIFVALSEPTEIKVDHAVNAVSNLSRRVRVATPQWPHLGFELFIPLNLIPLQEGLRFLAGANQRVRYRDGTLIVEQLSRTGDVLQTAELAVSPNLSRISSLRIRRQSGDGKPIDLHAIFSSSSGK